MGTVMVASASAYAPNVQKGFQAAANIISILERPPKIQDPFYVNQNEKVIQLYFSIFEHKQFEFIETSD